MTRRILHLTLMAALVLLIGTIAKQPVRAGNKVVDNDVLPPIGPLFPNPSGYVGTVGKVDTSNPFFQSLGTNGRSCSTCHQPSDGWTVSAAHVRQRFDATGGLDPIFRTVDGSVCDQGIQTSTVEQRHAAYRLLIQKGLLRIALPLPANAEFQVVSVSNPYGCNDTSTLSMYRRPLPATNLRFLSTVMWDGRESTPPSTQPITFATNPADLMADLAHQALDATLGHAQGKQPGPSAAIQQQIVAFETGLTTAQVIDFEAGNLDSGRATGGPAELTMQQFYIGLNDPFQVGFTPAIFSLYEPWQHERGPGDLLQRRASIARGEVIFNSKPINISGVAGMPDGPGHCGTCHDTPNVGNHSLSVPLNIGVADLTNPLGVDYLPVIELRNNLTGETVQTTDPGRALITGAWADIGKVKGPVLRGLAARAPYFHNGSAETLDHVVEFYEQRFKIGFTHREKEDLAAFLSTL